MSKVYDPYQMPPEDYVDAEGRDQIIGYEDDGCIDVYYSDHLRKHWEHFKMWLPLPSTPVKPRRYVIDEMCSNESLAVYDTVEGVDVGRWIKTREAAQAIADIYEGLT